MLNMKTTDPFLRDLFLFKGSELQTVVALKIH